MYKRQIGGLDVASDIDSLDDADDDVDLIRRGHCLYRDARGEVATTQWDIPTVRLKDNLDTSPHGAAARRATQAANEADDAEDYDHDRTEQEARV